MKHEITARRLYEAMADKGIKQRELADKAQINESSVSHYINGSHAPSNISAGKMAEVLGVNPVWLMGFDAPKIPTLPGQTVRVPIYGSVAAGQPIEAVENITGYEEIPASWQGEYGALIVHGDSMSPRIQDGDRLIVRKQSDAETGDIVVAMVNGETTVKKLIKHENGITLQPFNPSYEPMFFTHDVEIWGKVVEFRVRL